MDLPRKPKERGQVSRLDPFSFIVYRWVVKQRNTFYPLGEPLSDKERSSLLPYFDETVLDQARKVDLEKLKPRGVRANLRTAILKMLFRARHLAGLALVDCIFLQGPAALPVIFHEMVHLMQYHLLGPREFARRYLHSWAGGGFSYRNIALEQSAYELTEKFIASPGRHFSVREKAL